jgi:hypothetical protein
MKIMIAANSSNITINIGEKTNSRTANISIVPIEAIKPSEDIGTTAITIPSMILINFLTVLLSMIHT